jgi:hypothetical protein
VTPPTSRILALGLGCLACGSTPHTCISVGVNYSGAQKGVVLVTGASTIDSGLQFFFQLAAVPPAYGVVGATVCGGAPKGDSVQVISWLDDGGTDAFCALPLTPACSPPPGAPQASQIVMEVGGVTTNIHLIINDPDAGTDGGS